MALQDLTDIVSGGCFTVGILLGLRVRAVMISTVATLVGFLGIASVVGLLSVHEWSAALAMSVVTLIMLGIAFVQRAIHYDKKDSISMTELQQMIKFRGDL